MITEEEAIEIYDFNNRFRLYTNSSKRKFYCELAAREVLKYIPWSHFRKDWGGDRQSTVIERRELNNPW